MTNNDLKPLGFGMIPSISNDSLSKYSKPYPNPIPEEQKEIITPTLTLEQVLPLEENLQSLLIRLKEAQEKSIQNRRNLQHELCKEKKKDKTDKNLDNSLEMKLKDDDLMQFFTNPGELKTLNEENLEEIEKDTLIIDYTKEKPKTPEEKPNKYQVKEYFGEVIEEIGSEGKVFDNDKKALPSMDVKPSNFKGKHQIFNNAPKNLLIVLEGWLQKKSPHIVQGWQSRYCRLIDRKFMYYKEKDLENPMGVLDFDMISLYLTEIKDNGKITGFILQPKNCQKTFIFKTHKKKDKGPNIEEWVKGLRNHMEKSIGERKNLIELAKTPRFWRDQRISESKFKSKADTLDVLLFRGKNLASKFQRSFTGSHYDHVALILRYGNNELVLLEATGKEGVGLCSWSCFMRNKWHLLYKKLVLRHLEMQRTDKMIETLEKFVKQVIGKKFSVNLKKLFRKKSETFDIEGGKSFENRTFFCSELVAAAYKVLGILPGELAASQYYPGAFSKEQKLKLKNGARFTEEYLVDFSL